MLARPNQGRCGHHHCMVGFAHRSRLKAFSTGHAGNLQTGATPRLYKDSRPQLITRKSGSKSSTSMSGLGSWWGLYLCPSPTCPPPSIVHCVKHPQGQFEVLVPCPSPASFPSFQCLLTIKMHHVFGFVNY